jgi:hypothetical protein
MKPILFAGIIIVNLALIFYSVAIILQSRRLVVTRQVLAFLSAGVIFDISATVCMIISSGSILTLHGIVGYTSLAGMLTDTVLSWRHARKHGIPAELSPRFNRFTLIAYSYWVVAYITGVIIIATR